MFYTPHVYCLNSCGGSAHTFLHWVIQTMNKFDKDYVSDLLLRTYLTYRKAVILFDELYSIAKSFAEQKCSNGKSVEEDWTVVENPWERLSDLQTFNYVEFDFESARVRIYPNGKMECK